MGIATYVAESLLREHRYKPIAGDVFLIGRQTMFFPPSHALEMLRRCELPVPNIAADDIPIDTSTRAATGQRFIRDDAFFNLIGVPRIRVLDHSDYEGADIIHDLNRPLPESLHGVADFILDGSTLDNVFEPGSVLRAMAAMLRPGGRLVSINVGSNCYFPYTIPTPLWMLDYFVVNRFADCKVYVIVHHRPGFIAFYTIDLEKVRPDFKELSTFPWSGSDLALLVVAEKGHDSTFDRTPSQCAYRSSEDWQTMLRNLELLKSSRRPHPCASVGEPPSLVLQPLYIPVDLPPSRGRAATYQENSEFMKNVPAKHLLREFLFRLRRFAFRF